MAKVLSVNISQQKGTKKQPVIEGCRVNGTGLEGDGHAGNRHRQISLLDQSSIDKMTRLGANDLTPGTFAENITSQGIDLYKLPLGSRLLVGDVVLVVTQIGKECHKKCAIYYQAGDCIMPREGIFARVLEGGTIHNGDPITFFDAQPVA